MGKNSQDKGAGGEREIANIAKAYGFADAVRTGFWKANDVLVTIMGIKWIMEVKRRKRCLGWIYKELDMGRDCVHVREDYGYWITILRTKDFFTMAQGKPIERIEIAEPLE